MNKKINLLLLSAALLAAALACSLPQIGRNEPEPTATVSVEAAEELERMFEEAIQSAQETGKLTVTMTEEQLTAYLAVSLAEQPDLPISNPRVDLREGEMEVLGTYTAAVSAEVSVVMVVSVDENALPVIEVKSASIGPLPVPGELLAGISQAINEALTGEIGSTTSGFKLETIVISEGEIALTGSLND